MAHGLFLNFTSRQPGLYRLFCVFVCLLELILLLLCSVSLYVISRSLRASSLGHSRGCHIAEVVQSIFKQPRRDCRKFLCSCFGVDSGLSSLGLTIANTMANKGLLRGSEFCRSMPCHAIRKCVKRPGTEETKVKYLSCTGHPSSSAPAR